jgi:hypothetical protein
MVEADRERVGGRLAEGTGETPRSGVGGLSEDYTVLETRASSKDQLNMPMKGVETCFFLFPELEKLRTRRHR